MVSSQLCYGRDQEQIYCKGVSCPGKFIIIIVIIIIDLYSAVRS